MNKFSDLGIVSTLNQFVGDKIRISKILNREIIVEKYLIGDSKFKNQVVKIQINLDGESRIVFTGSKVLIDVLDQVPKDKFPFKTTIIQNGESFQFT